MSEPTKAEPDPRYANGELAKCDDCTEAGDGVYQCTMCSHNAVVIGSLSRELTRAKKLAEVARRIIDLELDTNAEIVDIILAEIVSP